MKNEKIRIKMLETVLPDTSIFSEVDKIALVSREYDAVANKYGAISVICANGKRLGVRPGEFEFIEVPEWVLNIHNNFAK